MERLWFVALDTVRLRNAISDAHASAVEPATVDAAHDAGVQLLDACIVGTGMRCIVRARDRDQIRTFSRRFVARVAPLVAQSAARWQPAARACRVPESSAGSWRAFLTRCRQAFRKSATMAVEISAPTRPSTARSRGTPRTRARKGASLVRRIQTAVDIALGGDESAARLRRYVADHDAPPNDAAAFARMCEVIFSQGIGFAVVARKREALERAFAGFAPAAVAAFSESDVRRALGEPIIRNIAKIRACVANAKRWCTAPQGSYLAFLASQAPDDDPMSGWPALTALVQGDFQRLNDIGARQTLKRWGFFTALGHPGSRRVIERLGLIAADTPAAEGQAFIGAIADVMSRDPYEVEGVIALFAALGPCRPQPLCAQCALADRCPSASADA